VGKVRGSSRDQYGTKTLLCLLLPALAVGVLPAAGESIPASVFLRPPLQTPLLREEDRCC